MENIYWLAGKMYYIPKEEQEEFTFDFWIGSLYVYEELYVKWEMPTFYKSLILKIYSIKFNDEYYKAKNIKEKYNEFLKSNVTFYEKEKKYYAHVFGYSYSDFESVEERDSFEKSLKEVLRKKIMPSSEADWQEFLCNNGMKNGMIKYFDSCFKKLQPSEIKEANAINTGAKYEKKALEYKNYLDKEKRRFAFLNSKLHLFDSLGIDEYFFESLSSDLQRGIVNLCIPYSSGELRFFNMVTSNNNIPLEKRIKFVKDVLNKYNSKKENPIRLLTFADVQGIINNVIKNDKEILKQTLNKLVSDYLGVTDCNSYFERNKYIDKELEIILFLFTTNEGLEYLKEKFTSGEKAYTFEIDKANIAITALNLQNEKNKIENYCLEIGFKIKLLKFLSYEQVIELHDNFSKYHRIIEIIINEDFNKLSSNLKSILIKKFFEGNQDILNKFSSEFLNLLIANEKLQNFIILYPNEINALMEIYQSTPQFLKIEPLSKVVMFFKASKDFDWKDDIRKKFCSVVGNKFVQDKNLISFLAKCQNEKQMRVICEIYHYGGNKINVKFGINEINHFEIICKMLEEFSYDDETYNFYRMNLAKLYANAEKIGLFKNEFLYNDGGLFRSDEIFLLEVSRCPDIVDKLISGELSFDNAIDNVLSNDFLLFYWIGHTNLKFSNLPLIRNLFLSFRDIFANVSKSERYNVVNNIYELRKFVCNLSDDFNLSSENFVEFAKKLREVVKIPGALSKLNAKRNNIETVQAAIEILDNNSYIQEISNDLETRVNLINYYSDQFVNEPYWYQSYLTPVDYTIFDLDSKNIEYEIDKNLIDVAGTFSSHFKREDLNFFATKFKIYLKFFAQKAICDSKNLDIRFENLIYPYEKSLMILKKKIKFEDYSNIQPQIDSLKKYFTSDLSDLNLNYINTVNNLDDIKNDLKNILNELSAYKSNCRDFEVKYKIGSLCKNIKEYLYPCVLLHKVLIPEAKMMIEEKNKSKTDEINLTAIPQILNEKINSRKERKYIFNKLTNLNENNMRHIKDLLVENPDNLILIVRLFNIIDITKGKMIEKKDKVNISLEPMANLDNDHNTFIKTDINNMFGLFKYETFSFLNSNPDIAEFILGLNCVNVDLLNVGILKRIKQLQEFCSVRFLTVYVRAVLNAVDYVEQDKQEVMLRLLNGSYINFFANKNVFGVLSQYPYLGIVMNYLPGKVNVIFKIMQDDNAIGLLERICHFTNDVNNVYNLAKKLLDVYELYPKMIKENMTVKELQNIELGELRYRKQYEEILKKSTQVKWYQRTKTHEQKRQAIASTADSLMQKINYLQSKSLKNYFANILINAKDSIVMREDEKMRREFDSSNRASDQAR